MQTTTKCSCRIYAGDSPHCPEHRPTLPRIRLNLHKTRLAIITDEDILAAIAHEKQVQFEINNLGETS